MMGLTKILLLTLISIFTFSFINTANAGYGNRNCRWVPAHMERGVWREGHRECWGHRHNGHCRFVGGYWHNGVWHRPHRKCW